MTNDGKDKFVQQMMLDFDKADLDKDGTINFSGKDVVFSLTQAKKGGTDFFTFALFKAFSAVFIKI